MDRGNLSKRTPGAVQGRVEPAPSPFEPEKVLTMSPE